MAYLGRQPVLGNFVKLDAITVVNGQAAYTMQNGGVNFTDYTTVNQFLVSLNGTIQAATDSFTVSGSTITFASNLSTGDVIDFIIVFGNSLSAGTVSDSAITTAKLADSSVTTAKLNDASVSLAKLTATGTKDATTFLRGDNTFAEPSGGGITMADQWRVTANVTLTDPAAFVTSNWERNDNSGYGGIGTGMTESSGVFSFPSTGIYLIEAHGSFQQNTGLSDANALFIHSTIDNSSYTFQTGNLSFGDASGDHSAASSTFLFDVTDISNCKVKFQQYGVNGILRGSSTQNRTHVTFIRLGDT